MQNPCLGIAVKMPDLVEDFIWENGQLTGAYEISLEKEEELSAATYSVEESLPEWSKKFPGQKFVFVDSECVGGICLEGGFVCKNGEKIFIQEMERGVLGNLLKHGDIQEGWYFEPLTRSFFE